MPEPQKFSKRPLYLQVRDLLAQRIAQGEWKPGAMLPSEDELARQLGVSMGTMRKALDGLEEERLVLRRQGRGTSVVDQTSDAMLHRFNGLADESGKPIGGNFEVLQRTTRRADATEQKRLQLNSGEMVLHVARLQRDQGRPLMYEVVSLALSRLPGLDVADGGANLLTVAQKCGVHLASAEEEVRLAQAPPAVAEHLGVEPGTILLKLDRVIYMDAGQPVQWRVGFCHLPQKASYATLIK
jgi:GntR family transcriptional regulator